MGQTDQAIMDKDLEVAENILATLLKQSSSDQLIYLGRGQQIEAKYLANYGVVFNVASNHFKFSYNRNDNHDNAEVDWEVMEDESSKSMSEIFQNFLADYGHMIRQLRPTDKILVKTESQGNWSGVAVFAGQKKMKKKNPGLSAEVTKSDMEAYEKGDLSRDELLEKIRLNEYPNVAELEPQLEVFSSMLARLYEVDLTDTYYMANEPDYDRMKNFGITYYLKYYSSTVHDDDNYSLPTISRKNVSKAERDKLVEEMYPDFIRGFKQNILDYGHILKTIDPNEMLVFHIKLTSCEGCKMPAIIEVSTKKAVVNEYRDGKIDLDKAISMIEVKTAED